MGIGKRSLCSWDFITATLSRKVNELTSSGPGWAALFIQLVNETIRFYVLAAPGVTPSAATPVSISIVESGFDPGSTIKAAQHAGVYCLLFLVSCVAEIIRLPKSSNQRAKA